MKTKAGLGNTEVSSPMVSGNHCHANAEVVSEASSFSSLSVAKGAKPFKVPAWNSV